MKAKLIPIGGGAPVSIQEGTFTVGRHAITCDVVVSGDSVSRVHCVLINADRGLIVRDNGSTNGTKVNGKRITQRALNSGDTLSVGDTEFLVQIDSHTSQPATDSVDSLLHEAPDVHDVSQRIWYYRKNNAVYGPANFETLNRWAGEGRFERDDEVRIGDEGAWQAAEKIEELFPEPQSPVVPAVASAEGQPNSSPKPPMETSQGQSVSHVESPASDVAPTADGTTSAPAATGVEPPQQTVPAPSSFPCEPKPAGSVAPSAATDSPARSVPPHATPPKSRKPNRDWSQLPPQFDFVGSATEWIKENVVVSAVVMVIVLAAVGVFLLFSLRADAGLGRVSGTVTLDGKPLEKAAVLFLPEKGRISIGVTDTTGFYELDYTRKKRGALVGRHAVRIAMQRQTSAPQEMFGPPAMPARPPEAGKRHSNTPPPLPEKYNTKTTLSAVVKPGSNTFDFTLESGGSRSPQASPLNAKPSH